MQLIMMGPPGSGKGTQAELIVDKLNIPHVSTGDMFRRAINEGTELGTKAKEYLDAGSLVPDEVTIGIVKERLNQSDCRSGFLLDGFPRTLPQAEALDSLLDNLNFELDAVLNIYVSEEELIRRLTGRRMCEDCGTAYHMVFNPPSVEGRCDKCGGKLYQRDDDTEDTILNRLKVYREQTEPIIDYYRKKDLVKDINGDQKIEDVSKEIGRKIGRQL